MLYCVLLVGCNRIFPSIAKSRCSSARPGLYIATLRDCIADDQFISSLLLILMQSSALSSGIALVIVTNNYQGMSLLRE